MSDDNGHSEDKAGGPVDEAAAEAKHNPYAAQDLAEDLGLEGSEVALEPEDAEAKGYFGIKAEPKPNEYFALPDPSPEG